MTRPAQRITALSISALIACGLCACKPSTPKQSAQPAPAEAATPAKPLVEEKPYAALMRAVFGQGYRPEQDDAIAELPDPAEQGARARMLLGAVNATVLPSGETVLVVAGEYADDKDEALSTHAMGGKLSLYLLRQQGSVWQVVRRHDNIAELGSHGSLGETRWVKQSSGAPLLAVLHGGVWQGYFVTDLALFDPAATQVRNLVEGSLRVHSDSEGACVDETEHCWEVDAKWHLAPSTGGAAYDDLVLAFAGWDEKLPAQAEAGRVRTTVSGTARYGFDQGSYRLQGGTNPMPDH